MPLESHSTSTWLDASVIAVIALGLFHGLNPGQGWLFATFTAIYKRSIRYIPLTIAVVLAGHIASIAPIVAIYLIIQRYFDLANIPVAISLIVVGIYRFARYAKHYRVSLRISYLEIFLWSVLIGLSHGSGLSLLPFLGSHEPHNPYHYPLFLVTIHFLVTGITMLTMATITTYILNLNALRRIWINFDSLWAIILLIIGVALLINYFITHGEF
ncbi:MAG: hypothetical protein DJ555_00790 [Desulfurococcaceae archaeon]|nr:MAG: hypothetical protein DJ555_00790 [Desulfurococcaceae archaeon]